MSNKKLAASLLLLSVLNCGCGDDVTEVIMVSPSLYEIHESFTLNPDGVVRETLNCNEGDLATGGGFFLNSSGIDLEDRLIEVFSDAPAPGVGGVAKGWDVGIRNKAAVERIGYLYVVCLVDAVPATP